MEEIQSESWKLSTRALHSGYNAKDHIRSAAVPIYQTSSFTFDNAQYGADLFNLVIDGHIYSRTSNPTLDVLEKRIAALEGGVGALAVSSGNAATDTAISTLASVGDNIIATTELYGGTHNILSHILPSRGIKTTFINKDDFDGLERAIDDKTKAIFVESIGNPSGGLVDIKRFAEIAHRAGIVLIVDNTVATPILLRPFEYGADIIVHSATKYIGGHGNAIGGLVVDSGKFDWIKHKVRYPQFSQPDPSYHDTVFTDRFKEQAFIARARTVPLRNSGAVLSAHSASLFLQGLETLALRIAQISKNTNGIVNYLSQHELVANVRHISVLTHPDYALAKRYLGERGVPGIVSFELKGGKEASQKFYDSLNLFLRLVNIGDNKSLAAIPAQTTHRQMSEQALAQVGITPGLIRLSIGIEDLDDLIQDLKQALNHAK